PVAAVRAEADRLRGDVDVLVALTHLGLDAELALAREVPALDLVVGGHSHTRLEAARRVGDTWVVQAGSYQQGLGVAVVDPADPSAFRWELRTPRAEALPAPPSAAVEDWVVTWDARVTADWGMIVGRSAVALDRSGDGESPLGRWVCSAIRRSTGADLAVVNSGGLRADLPAGDLTREDVYRILPFGNEIVLVDVPGAALGNLALRNATARLDPERAYAFPQDGLVYSFRTRLGSAELVTATVGGASLDPSRIYRVATTDFVVGQWERIFGIAAGPVTEVGRTELAGVLDDLARGEVTAAPPDPGRRVP
nr:bifunctional metallophosphatase/5'-nucleotidase [Deltaproteobacteria bacterium]